VKVVERQLDAVNYFKPEWFDASGFRGTSLLPGAKGDAKVNSVTGKTEISCTFEGLSPANGLARSI